MVIGSLVSSPCTGGKLPERDSLLRGQIDQNETIDTGLSAVRQQLLLSVCPHGVVVAHQQDWGLEALFPGVADHLQSRSEGDTIFEGDSIGSLDCGSVCYGVCEGHSELDDVFGTTWWLARGAKHTAHDRRDVGIPEPPLSIASMISGVVSALG